LGHSLALAGARRLGFGSSGSVSRVNILKLYQMN